MSNAELRQYVLKVPFLDFACWLFYFKCLIHSDLVHNISGATQWLTDKILPPYSTNNMKKTVFKLTIYLFFTLELRRHWCCRCCCTHSVFDRWKVTTLTLWMRLISEHRSSLLFVRSDFITWTAVTQVTEFTQPSHLFLCKKEVWFPVSVVCFHIFRDISVPGTNRSDELTTQFCTHPSHFRL